MRLERRERVPPLLGVAAPVLAVLAAVLLCGIPIALAGAPLLDAWGVMAKGALGSRFAITETLSRATPLILTGLAASVAFRAKLWNIGAEGQLYVGALVTAALGTGAVGLPSWLLVPFLAVFAMAAAGLWMLGPTVLKTRFGVDEVVTTLLLNFVVLLFVSMMLEGPMKDPLGMGWPQSAAVVGDAALPKIVPRTRLHLGFVLAIVAAVLVWLMMQRTVWGFEMRATGANPSAARFAGMRVGRVMLRVGFLSGALAGLAGFGEVAGLKGYLTQDLSPGYGYSGIVVAMLAQLNALAVIPAAIFVAAIFVGADSMSRAMGISSYIANLVVAASLLTVLVSGLLVQYRVRR
jgi:simple sugar transport system permease protein